MCIFIHKEENENCRKNTISAKRLFIYYNKKNINEKFHKKKTKQINPSWWNVPTLVVLQLQSD